MHKDGRQYWYPTEWCWWGGNLLCFCQIEMNGHVSSWLMLLFTYTDIRVILTYPTGFHLIPHKAHRVRKTSDWLSCWNQLHLACIPQILRIRQSAPDQNIHDSHGDRKGCIDISVTRSRSYIPVSWSVFSIITSVNKSKDRRVHFRFSHQHPDRSGTAAVRYSAGNQCPSISSLLMSDTLL